MQIELAENDYAIVVYENCAVDQFIPNCLYSKQTFANAEQTSLYYSLKLLSDSSEAAQAIRKDIEKLYKEA